MVYSSLRIVCHDNVPEEVLELSCSWFLDVFVLGRGVIWPQIQF